MLFLLILYYRKQINYDLSDCLHASITELRHICISKRWGSKLPLMKAAKVNINKRILSTLWFFLYCSICPSYVEMKTLWNTSLVPIQWAKPHDATKMAQLLCVKLEDPKHFTSQALRRSRAVIHLPIPTNKASSDSKLTIECITLHAKHVVSLLQRRDGLQCNCTRENVHTSLLCLGNGWTDCAQFLSWAETDICGFDKATGASVHVRTCTLHLFFLVFRVLAWIGWWVIQGWWLWNF